MLTKMAQNMFLIQGFVFLFLLTSMPSKAQSTNNPLSPPPASNDLPKKEDLLIQAAELEREADKKQITDINGAKELRNQAKNLKDQADKMK